MDSDFHKILNKNEEIINCDKEIVIGNDVWIACRNTILKGSNIGNNNVIAANSTICGKVSGKNQIIGGNPYKILKSNVYWER